MAAHVCPVWVGHLLANPLRKLIQNPDKILLPYVSPGMVAADIGCAMGFFSIPMARLVTPGGRVVCVDLQEKMLANLKKRAARAGVDAAMTFRRCTRDGLGLEDFEQGLDFALAFAVVHEVPDPAGLFAQVFAALKPGGRFFVAEPSGHVSDRQFDRTLDLARSLGFDTKQAPVIRASRAAVLEKQAVQ